MNQTRKKPKTWKFGPDDDAKGNIKESQVIRLNFHGIIKGTNDNPSSRL